MEDTHFRPPQPPFIEVFYNTTLPKLRIDRFRFINQFIIIASSIYSLLVIFTTPAAFLTKFILVIIGSIFGLILLAYFHLTQKQEFTTESNFYVSLAAIAVLAAVTQISGGIASPFLFFYILIVIFTGLTLPTKESYSSLALIVLLVILHAILPSIDLLDITQASRFNFFLITWGRILVIASYVLLIILDLIKKDDNLLQINSELEKEVANLKKFNLLTKTYQSLGTLRGTLNYYTLTQLIPMTISKLLGNEAALLFLKENDTLNYVSSWSRKTESVIKDSSFSKCLLKHESTCIVNRLNNIEKIVTLESSKLVEECSPPCSDVLKSLGTKYFVLAPLKVTDQALGVIVMGFSERREFQWDELEVLRIFTYTTVLAIENARFYSKTRENFERYNAILTELIDAVVVVDKNNKIILLNNQAENLIGAKASDAVGKQVREVLYSLEDSGEKTPPEDTAIFKALQSDQVIVIPKRFYKKPDGNLVPVTVSAKSIKDESGSPIGVMLLIRNLTEKIEFERTRNEFISVASRELRTPITTTKEFLQRIREDKTGKMSERQKNFLELAFKGNERQLRLVDDLLRVSKIERGKERISKKSVDLKDVTKTAVEDFIYQARRKKQHLAYRTPKRAVKVKADPIHIREILSILLGNAVKYTKWGGEITIYHTVGKDTITTSVVDNGPAIPKDVAANLFKKFYRDPKIASKIEGTGLGLYIVKQLVKMMEGSVSVKSDSKNGVVFSFSLPKS